MRQILIVLTILVLCSCRQGNEQNKSSQNSISPSLETKENVNSKSIEKEIVDWEKYQDLL